MHIDHLVYRKKSNLSLVMIDVIIALIPAVLVAYYAFGTWTLIVVGTSVLFCLLAELLFNVLFTQQKFSLPDGSAIITGLLLALTLSPLTPWYVVAFGASCAILFGKILWGGIGKNRFNPALLGRECMVAFFPEFMNGTNICNTKVILQQQALPLSVFEQEPIGILFKNMFYNPTGALGEYSIVALLLGGFYLIICRRITWHIPAVFFIVFFGISWLVPSTVAFNFSVGGIVLGGLFMATDMPSSPSHNRGKLFYGVVLALVTAIFIGSGVRFAFLSLAILTVNAFVPTITEKLRPTTWGHLASKRNNLEAMTSLLFSIVLATLALVALEHAQLLAYTVYIFMLYTAYQYIVYKQEKLHHPI